MTPTRAPTADELLADSTVIRAIEDAWQDSDVADPLRRHEEGGWIYLELTTGQIATVRAFPGAGSAIDLGRPPEQPGWMVVGIFHTHPNPTADGWFGGPSPSDVRIDAILGIPDLIRADDGIHRSGPPSRRGGLTGKLGFPD
jgi:hypothetical protein